MANLFAEVGDSFKAYGAAGHRHLPEIEQGLHDVQPSGAAAAQVTFVPHLLPLIRGIHVTSYVKLLDTSADIQALFTERYKNEAFVDVLPEGVLPETRTVKTSNICRIAQVRPQGRDTLVILSVIDNLTKGASGQAVQNMNLMFGFDETAGLSAAPLLP